MTRLAIGLALLICAALLAAVGVILLRLRWKWEEPTGQVTEPYAVAGVVWRDGQPVFGTGSPWSVTSRADNGTIWEVRQK